MSRLTNILRIVQRAGNAAERIAKKRLAVRRKGNAPMNTFGLLSDSITFKLKANGHLAQLTLESFEEGLALNDGFGKNIPYTRGSGAKKPSMYIHSLAIWAAKKFYAGNYKAGLRAAFAIANKQKQEKTAPKHPGWMDEIREKIDKEINAILSLDTMTAVHADVMKKLNIKI